MLKDKKEQDSKSEHASSGGGWFKFKEGENMFRVLAEPEVIFEDFNLGMCYTDCRFQGSMKYMTYILNKPIEDPNTWKIQLMKMPMKIFDVLAKLEEKKATQFTMFPMPYDLDVEAENAGTKEVKYVTLPGEHGDVPKNFLEEFFKKKSIAEIVVKMKERNKEKHMQDGTYARLHGEVDSNEPKRGTDRSTIDYPKDEINPDDIPF